MKRSFIRIVIVDKETKEPLGIFLSLKNAADYFNVHVGVIIDLCEDIRRERRTYPELPYDLMYAHEWEKQFKEYLPGYRVELK